MTDQACKNTDRELWREREGDYYADSIHVTEDGGIGINCGGHVFVKPVREWHRLANSISEEQIAKQRFARELLMHVTGKSYYDNGSKMRARWCLLCDTETPPDAERLTHKPGCLAAEAEEAAK